MEVSRTLKDGKNERTSKNTVPMDADTTPSIANGIKRKTNIKSIDALMDGGLSTNTITTVAGLQGTGKTLVLLSMAVLSEHDCVLYSPKLSYGEIKSRIAKICIALGIDMKDIHYDITESLWMIVKLKTHVIRIAGHGTTAVATTSNFIANVKALVDSGAANMVLVDSPCKIAYGINDREEAELLKSLDAIATRTNTPVIVTVLVKRNAAKDRADLKEWLSQHVLEYSSHIVFVDGWPEVKGGNAILRLLALTYDSITGKWTCEKGQLKMKHVFGNHSIEYRS